MMITGIQKHVLPIGVSSSIDYVLHNRKVQTFCHRTLPIPDTLVQILEIGTVALLRLRMTTLRPPILGCS
jgi:hypothetical protein